MALQPYASNSAAAMHGALVPIASTTISGSSTSAFSFTSIPQTYQDLRLVITTRSAQPGNNLAVFYLWANGDESSATGLYSATNLQGDGTSATSSRQTSQNQAIIGFSVNNGATSGIFASNTIDILNYTNTTTFKTSLSRSAGDLNGSGATLLVAALRRSTSAITSLYFRADGGYAQIAGATATLYGIRTVGQ
jgi:hypothetical protein